jgi:hypothetical protein
MKSTHKQPWYLCYMCLIIKCNYPFGNQNHLQFVVLMFRKSIISRRFSYSSFRIFYGFTGDEICSLQLVSLLQTHTSQSFTLIYRAFHIWYLVVVRKLRVTFGVELGLKTDFYLLNIPKYFFYVMTEQSVTTHF